MDKTQTLQKIDDKIAQLAKESVNGEKSLVDLGEIEQKILCLQNIKTKIRIEK